MSHGITRLVRKTVRETRAYVTKVDLPDPRLSWHPWTFLVGRAVLSYMLFSR